MKKKTRAALIAAAVYLERASLEIKAAYRTLDHIHGNYGIIFLDGAQDVLMQTLAAVEEALNVPGSSTGTFIAPPEKSSEDPK